MQTSGASRRENAEVCFQCPNVIASWIPALGAPDGRNKRRCHRPSPVADLIGDDRATQYSRAVMMNTNALEYWVTRFRG